MQIFFRIFNFIRNVYTAQQLRDYHICVFAARQNILTLYYIIINYSGQPTLDFQVDNVCLPLPLHNILLYGIKILT